MDQTSPPRILVVDDEGRVREVVCQMLAALGYRVEGAASSHEGLELFRRGDYDAVMTDFLMPGGTGLDLVEGVRRVDPTIGVIMLTGAATDLDAPSRRLEFMVLRKPVELSGLQVAVRQALGRRVRGTPAALN